MNTSIQLSQSTKELLERVKPGWLTWNEFLVVLFEAADKKRMDTAISRRFDAEEALAVEEAKARYYAYRKNPQDVLTAGELKQRLQMKQASQRMRELTSLLEGPSSMTTYRVALQTALANTDKDIHVIRKMIEHDPPPGES